ncbi:hypothetical protein, partial [Lacticaseibacillus paracasei]|uniref:hypothetical protein n=1 Tax=Lacticaseibacillus paracasei TaxID=1597 RepID=UPI001F240917
FLKDTRQVLSLPFGQRKTGIYISRPLVKLMEINQQTFGILEKCTIFGQEFMVVAMNLTI